MTSILRIYLTALVAVVAIIFLAGAWQQSTETKMSARGFMRYPIEKGKNIDHGHFWESPEKCEIYHKLLQ